MMARLGNGLTLILLLACGGAVAVLHQLRQDASFGVPQRGAELTAVESAQALPDDLVPPRNLDTGRPFIDTDLLLERPLFTDGRRPPEVPELDQSSVANAAIMLPFNYVLEGVISAGSRSAVLLRSSLGQDRSNLRIGETLDGWKLLRVDPQQAEFGRDTQRLVLELEVEFERGAAAVEWQRVGGRQ